MALNSEEGRPKRAIDVGVAVHLAEIPRSGGSATGISDLCSKDPITRCDVIAARGEFAGYFADGAEVVLFRDRLGARNLFYAVENGTAIFSNDLSWVAKQVSTEPNWTVILSDYLQFQIPFTDETFFTKIRKVMPGEFVRINRQGLVTRETYWDLEFGERPFDKKHLLDLIVDAVEFRLSLIGKAPYTSYLSGGLDSSTITLLAKPTECFSGFYKEEGYSEMDYIEAVLPAGGLPERYVPVQITEQAFRDRLGDLPKVLADPCAGLGVIPQVIVAEAAARQGYKYAFTGEGGDEIFLGYNWNTMVFCLAGAARGLLRDRYMVRYEPMVEKVLRDGFAAFTGGLLARGDDVGYATRRILEIWDRNQPVENNILKINLKAGLPAILTLDEQVGRYAGIEPISPLVDHHIVEYVCSVRPSERAPIPKAMMRDALAGILPEKIRMRYEKMGFPVPFKTWDWPMIEPALGSLRKRGVLDVDPSKHETMDRETWALYSIEAWCEHYFGKPTPRKETTK
jgi:asparagine synthase (glutamine-hydrolysing)